MKTTVVVSYRGYKVYELDLPEGTTIQDDDAVWQAVSESSPVKDELLDESIEEVEGGH